MSQASTLAAPPPADGRVSQASSAFFKIKSDIIAGRYAPDERLKIADLVAELDVSPGAVREALSRLVPEQLVVVGDYKGFTVAPLSTTDLLELTDIRCEIEAIALRRTIERGDVEWESQLVAAAYRLQETPIRVDSGAHWLNPKWIQRHGEFHLALVSACGNKRLVALHKSLYEQSERYRGLSSFAENRDVSKEHQEILDIALSRDADGLVWKMQKHMRLTTEFIIDNFASKM